MKLSEIDDIYILDILYLSCAVLRHRTCVRVILRFVHPQQVIIALGLRPRAILPAADY